MRKEYANQKTQPTKLDHIKNAFQTNEKNESVQSNTVFVNEQTTSSLTTSANKSIKDTQRREDYFGQSHLNDGCKSLNQLNSLNYQLLQKQYLT
mgnify:CR=1 FL=1